MNKKIFFCFVMISILALSIFLPIKKDIDLVQANQQREEISSVQDFLDFESSIIELNNDNSVEPIYISNTDTMMALNDAAIAQDGVENDEDIVNEHNIKEYCDLHNSYYISSANGYSIYTNFALKRLIVNGDIPDAYGAIKVISGYNDISILCYETEAATEYAYNKLIKNKNLSVSIDKFSAPSSYAQTSYDYSSYKNWGAKAADIGGYTQYLKDNNVNKEVVVVVMDTGINTSHEMFEGRLLTDKNGKVRGYSYFNSPYHYSYDNLAFDVDDLSTSGVNEADTNKYSFEDDNKHGTHVAGIICSLTPANVKILPIKISDPAANNTSTFSIYLAAYSRIIEIYSNQYNIACVNLSFSGAGKRSESDKNIFNQQSYVPLKAKNIIPITAAGNESEEINIEGLEAVVVSALKETSISVEFDRSYSNYGKIIDIAAAGTRVVSAAISSTDSPCTSDYIALKGTSMAAPQVAGVVALLYLDPIYNSSACSAAEIENRLYENAIDLGDPGYDVLYGCGALNLRYFEAEVDDDIAINFYNGDELLDPSQSFMYLEESFDLNIKCSDPSYSIYYSKSTNYFMPNALTEVEYTSPLLINNTAYIRAIAYKMSGNNIVSRSNMYTISFFIDSGNIEDYFTITSGGKIIEYTGHFTKLDVPGYVKGVQVKEIGSDVFAYSELEYITLPASCQSIGKRAFKNCENLTYIYAPSVKKICLEAFWQCESLRIVTINTPESDATEGAYFPKLTELISRVFAYCTSLEECYLPNLIGIPEYTFYECSSLKSFHIGANVATLEQYAFYKNNLEEFTIDSNNKYFYTDGVAVYNSDTVLAYASGNPTKSLNILEQVTINGVTTKITKTAQSLLSGQTLNQVTIHKNMKELGYFFCSSGGYIDTLYYNAASLSDAYYEGAGSVTYPMFDKVSKLVIGETVVSFPQRLFLFTREIDEIVIKSINTSFGTDSLYQHDKEAKTNILYLDFTNTISSTWISNLIKSCIHYNLPNYIYTRVAQTFTGYFSSYKQIGTNADWIVYSTRKINSYTINHYQESLTNNGTFVDENGVYYRLIEQETQYGDAGSLTSAVAKAYEGFTAQDIIQQTIATDNSTFVNILYTRNSYTLTLSKDGFIQNVEGAGVYKYGQSVTINASTQEGYDFNKWISSNPKLTPDSSSQSYTFTMPANNITLTATSKVQTFTIEISYSSNGSVSPSGTQVVDYGSSLLLTITPDTYYKIKQVLIDNVNNSVAVNSGKYTFTNIKANHIVYVEFDHQTASYTVKHYQENLTNVGTLIDGTYYSLSESETLTGNVGFNSEAASKSYTGFTAQDIIQQTIATDNSTFVNILYTRNSYTLTLSKDGFIQNVEGAGVYKYGQSVTINASTQEGYDFNKWISSNPKLTPDSSSQSYTFTMPANNITLTATSKVQTFTIEISYSSNGSVSPSGTQVVDYGSSLLLTITPDTYYKIKQVLIDNVNNSVAVNSGKYSFTNIKANHIVYVEFDHQTASYTVKHYQENLTNVGTLIDGTYYSLSESETLTGNVGFNSEAASKSYTGFTAQSISQNVVAQDGSTIVNVLYKRTYFSLSLDKSTGISKVSGSGIYKYGQQISVNATLDEGYVWTKWTSSDTSLLADSSSQAYTFTMPAGNINLVGSAEKQTFAISITHSTGGTISVTGNYTIDKNGIYHVEYNSNITIYMAQDDLMKAIINAEFADGNTETFDIGHTFSSIGVEPSTTPTSIYVEFIVAFTTYTVNHYQENLAGEYNIFEYETLYGEVDTATSAQSNSYTGFTAQEFSQSTIVQDGTTIVNIYYNRNEYTLTLNKDDGIKTVSGAGAYKYGKEVAIDTTLNEGYNWNKWTSSDTSLLAHGTTKSYTFTMPAGNITLTASATIQTFTIAISSGENGKVTPSGTQLVNYNSSLTITITSNTNYKINQVLINGVNNPLAVTNRAYTFTNVKDNHTMYVTFVIATSSYTINHYQENVTTGYTMFESEALYGNAGDATAATAKTYTGFTALDFSQSTIAQDGSTTINIYYNRNQYTVTLNVDTGISSVSGAGTYKYGQEVTINATLLAGYSWNKWTSTNSSIVADADSQSYTFTMPNSNIGFTATSILQTFTITITHSEGGTISLSGKYTIEGNNVYRVNYNSKLTIEIYPQVDYKIEEVLVNGFNSSAAVNAGSYTFINISNNHVVHITFKFNAANYTVKHYQESLTNSGTLIENTYYNLFESETLSGGIGTTTQANAKTYTGFSHLSISQQIILEDGSAIVNVLYNRIEYSISVYIVEGVSKYLNENDETHPSVRTAKYGQSVSIKAILKAGYDFVKWDVASGSLSTDLTKNPCSFIVVDNIALSPTLAKQTFSITISSSTNGSVSPSGTQTINYGSSLTITISPNSGYEISQVLIDGVNNSADVNAGKYTLTNITANHTIYVEFKRQTANYIVNHYQESLTTTSNYLYNKYYTLANTETLTGNVGDVTTAIVKEYEGFTYPNITQQTIKADSSTTINIYYDRIEYTLTLNKDDGIASVIGAGKYKYGQQITVNAILNEGYSWNSWTSNTNKISSSSSQKYSFNMPDTNATLTASSVIQTFTIQISAIGGGVVSPNGIQTVGYGSSLAINITPNVNHEISKVLVDGVNKGPISYYAFENITQNHTLEATFIKLETSYIVNHYQENLKNSGILFDNLYYTLVDQETITGNVGDNTQAQAKTFDGFTALAITQKTIEREGTTIVDVLYIRNSYILSLNKDGGIASTSGDGIYKYGQSVSAEATLNDGYIWIGWSSDSNKIADSSNQKYTFNMPATDIALSATSRIKTFKITLNISGGCEVSYDNPLEDIVVGESRTLDIYCKEYWILEGVYVNGEKVEVVNNQITLTNITEDLTIKIVVIEQYRFHPLMIAGIIFGGGTLLAITIFIFVRKRRKKRWNWI